MLARREIIQKWTARAHEVKDHSYWRTHEGQVVLGDPWLSAGLLKDGDPIYLVKWEHDWERPKLLHIQSIRDVEIFGINAENYGRFVLDKPTWEARYGLSADSLVREPLQAATWGYWQGFPRGIGRRREEENPDWPGIALYPGIISPGYRGNALVQFVCHRGEDRWAAAVPFPGHVYDEPSRGLPHVSHSLFSKASRPYQGMTEPMLWRGGQVWAGGWYHRRLAFFTDTSERPWARQLFDATLESSGQAEHRMTITLAQDGREWPVELVTSGIETAAAWLRAECAREKPPQPNRNHVIICPSQFYAEACR